MNRLSPIGIDIGASSVKLAQLEWVDRAQGRWAPRRVRTLEMDRWAGDAPVFDGGFSAAIKSALAEGGFRGKRAVVVAPSSVVDIRPIHAPLAEVDELPSFIRAELTDRQSNVADQVMDYWIAGEVVEHGESKLEVYSVSAGEELMASLVRAVERAGVGCMRVDIAATCIACVLGGRIGEPEGAESMFVLDVGDRSSMLLALDMDGIRFCRQIKWGGHHVTARLKSALDIDMETASAIKVEWGLQPSGEAEGHPRQQQINDTIEAELRSLALEIGRSLAYRARSGSSGEANELCMVGGGARLHGMAEYLRDALKLKVTTGSVVATNGAAETAAGGRAPDEVSYDGYAAAIGAALSGMN